MPPSRFHAIQYIVAAILMALFGILYCFVKDSRSDAVLSLATLAGGFLFGKFTNGFKAIQKDPVEQAKKLVDGGASEDEEASTR